MNIRRSSYWATPLAALMLSACAPAPIYKAVPGSLAITPAQVAQAPGQYTNGQVIWGGSVVTVRNFPDHSEIEILDYPLDSSQRPRVNQQAYGRFIAMVPGYVESFNYPIGALVTISGQLHGTRAGMVDQAAYMYPVVDTAQSHVWTAAEMRQGHPNVQFGVGVGVGIR